MAPLDDLRERAVAVVSELFSLLEARSSAAGPLAGLALPGEAVGAARALLEIPWRSPVSPVTAGASTSISLRLENINEDSVGVSFYSSDLLSDSGGTIPSFALSFDPDMLNLGAGQQAVVTVQINVPPQTIPGAYSGLVQATGLSRVKAVITVDVI